MEAQKVHEKSKYKEGDKLLVVKGYLQDFIVDGSSFYGYYYVSEERVFGLC